MRTTLVLILLLFTLAVRAQYGGKSYIPVKVRTAPAIDGILNDAAWNEAEAITDFVMYRPIEGIAPTQRSEVKLVYDDYGIYVGATFYDTAPDSILHELGVRDNAEIVADLFRFGIDPYNKEQDCYIFEVYASGVQKDSRTLDPTYNGVWQSAAKIHDQGWSVEICIPYSAIRFPDAAVQTWGLQFARDIARKNEYDQWCLTPKDVNNVLPYWGKLKDIRDIRSPLRLSLTPFASFYYELAQQDISGKRTTDASYTYNFGADLKYGIDEKFTLDVTLLPDFSQVQSDNKVKNISYQEVTYNDNRPFFQEGTDLFARDNLFYSRRVGQTPAGFHSLPYRLEAGEVIRENPSISKLLNAVKLSGRNNSGLGIGLFNAITNNTYAEIEDSAGSIRKVLTEPLTNYNIVVFDQQLKNNSSVYLINTNVIRDKKYDDANVTGTGFTICNKKQSQAIDGSFALSQKFSDTDTLDNTYSDLMGYKYFIGTRRISGKFQWGISHSIINKTFDSRDLGYYIVNNKMKNRLYFAYNVYEPTRTYRQTYNTITFDYMLNPVTGKMIPGTQVYYDNYTELLNYWTLTAGGSLSPFETFDYNEPRVDGRYSRSFRMFYVYAGLGSNARKPLYWYFNVTAGNFIGRFLGESYSVTPGIRYRVNNRLTFKYGMEYSMDPMNFGFANFDAYGNSIYGTRKMTTFINTLTANYIFMNDMSLSLNARHYWNTCKYRRYYTLEGNGDIIQNDDYAENNDFNYNVFNIDLIYTWQFAPGSSLSFVYKNAIETQEQQILYNCADNFRHTLESPQTNSVSLKVLYYLDYQYLQKLSRKEKKA